MLLSSLTLLADLAARVATSAATALWAKRASNNARGAPSPTSFESIDSYIGQQLDRLNVPGAAIAIVESDQIVHQRGFGQARPGGRTPSPQTPFGLGSLTKSFTALAVMQLVEDGKVDLNAPVQRYLPWFRVADPQASTQINVRHLLDQTSGFSQTDGLPSLADMDNRPGANERQARTLARLRLSHPVGSTFEYSNVNYNLLGLIVEAVSGMRYETYIRESIFAPLEMTHSYTSRTEARLNGLAQGHRFWFAFPVAAPDMETPAGSLPAAQLLSSTEDMAHYLIAQLNGGRYGDTQILSPSGVAEMHRPAVEVNVMGVSLGRYGMGWFVQDRGQTPIIWHDGVVPDFFAYMALIPEQGKGIVLLFSADHFLMQIYGSEVGMGAATLLAGGQPAPNWLSAIIPWAVRGLLVIPTLQVLGVVSTLRRLQRWHRQPKTRPSRGRMFALDVLLPGIANLLLAVIPISILRSRLRGFLFLFAPDLSWLAVICGGFAGIWMLVRTGLMLRAFRRDQLTA